MRWLLPLILILASACGGTRERPDSRDPCPSCDTPQEICDKCPYPEDRMNPAAWGQARTCISRWGPQAESCWNTCLGTESSTSSRVSDWVLSETEFRRLSPDWNGPGNCDLPNVNF